MQPDRTCARALVRISSDCIMSAYFGGESWQVMLPKGWHGRHDPECETICSDDAVGALQISCAYKEGRVRDDDLRDFAEEHLVAGAKTRKVEIGAFSGFEFCYEKDGRYWRQWFLRNGSVALFVTYNCDLADAGVENGQVQSILRTLGLRTKAV